MFFGEFPELCHTKMQTPDQPHPIDRRIPDPTLLALLSKNQESHQQTLEKLGELSAKLNAHIENEHLAMQTAVTEGVKAALAEAFPGGDAAGHRKGHENDIANANERKKTQRVLFVEILKGLATAFSLWALYTLWAAAVRLIAP